MLNRYTVEKPYRGFESLSLRHKSNKIKYLLVKSGVYPRFYPQSDEQLLDRRSGRDWAGKLVTITMIVLAPFLALSFAISVYLLIHRDQVQPLLN